MHLSPSLKNILHRLRACDEGHGGTGTHQDETQVCIPAVSDEDKKVNILILLML